MKNKRGKCDICKRENVKINKVKYYNDITINMCQKHGHQWYEKGKITDPSPYSMHDGTNDYIEYEDYYEIILRKATECYKEVGRAIIDKDDYERCKERRWRLSSHTRNNGKIRHDVVTGSPNKNDMILLHQFIMNSAKGEVVDHKDGNTLDNRKSNLRICTQQNNIWNRTDMLATNTSGILGVYKDNREGRKSNWIAEIRYNDIKIYLGAFVNIEDAVYCRHYAETLLFKEFRPITHDDNTKPYIEKCLNKNNIENKVRNRIKAKIGEDFFDYSA
jgi:hypothetical protein